MKRRLPSLGQTNGINPLDHEGLVIYWARIHGARGEIRDSEQYADGMIGLLWAADRFDPSRGFKFSTYATRWIKQAIQRPLRSQYCHMRGNGKIRTIAFSQTRDPDGKLDWDPTSLVDDDPADRVSSIDESALCEEFLRMLCPREQQMVRLYYLHGKTYQEISASEEPHISRERVRQMINRAMAKLRRHAERREAERCEKQSA